MADGRLSSGGLGGGDGGGGGGGGGGGFNINIGDLDGLSPSGPGTAGEDGTGGQSGEDTQVRDPQTEPTTGLDPGDTAGDTTTDTTTDAPPSGGGLASGGGDVTTGAGTGTAAPSDGGGGQPPQDLTVTANTSRQPQPGTQQQPSERTPVDTSALSPGQRARLQQAQAEQRRDVAGQLGPEVDPWELSSQTFRQDGEVMIETSPTRGARLDLTASTLSRQLGFGRLGEPRGGRLSPGFVTAAEALGPDLEAGEDFTLEDGEVSLTPGFRIEEAARQSGLPESALEIEDGEVQTTPAFAAGQAAEAGAAAADASPFGAVGGGVGGGETPFGNIEGQSDVEARLGRTPFGGPGQVTMSPGAVRTRRQEQLEFARENPGPIAGPPGDIEQTVLGPITGPPSQLEQDITGGIEDRTQFLLGPPGERERAVGGFVAGGTQTLADLGRDFTEGFGAPAGGVLGEAVGNIPEVALDLAGEEAAGDAVEGAFEKFGRGLGRVPGEALAAPEGVRALGELGFEAGQDVAIQAGSGDVPEAGRAVTFGLGGAATAAGVSIAEEAAENPFETAGVLTGSLVGGAGAGRLVESAAIRARVAATTRGPDVDFEDITTPQAAETGALPEFRTSPGAPTRQAVGEVRERAADQPASLQETIGESILFRSEAERLGRDFEAGRGEFELPGLFASPEASPLRLDIGAAESSSLGLRLPRPFARPERLSAFESPDIEGMPAQATGARIISDRDTGGPIPDPRTSGARFLEGEAQPGTAFVRPTGSRTTELEAIFPPGSQFARVGTRRVDLPDEPPGTLDVFRRVDDDVADAPDAADAGDLVTGQEIIRRSERSGTPSGTPVIPVGPVPGVSGPTARPDEPTPTPTEPVTPTNATQAPTPTDVTVSDPTDVATAPTEPAPAPRSPFDSTTPTVSDPFGTTTTTVATDPTAVPSGPTTGVSEPGPTPTTPPSSPFGEPTTPPSSPPSTPPGSPPSAPPSAPPSSPPSRPPGVGAPPGSGPPTVPGLPGGGGSGPPQRPLTPDTDPDDRDEEEQFIAPLGTTFVNPIATGGQLLFGDVDLGGGGGGGDGENPDPTGLFLG